MDQLEQRVRDDLAKIRYATGDWCVPLERDGERVLDVAIIGGGQGGLATAFALRRRGLSNTCIFDQAARGG
ncbi:MAG: FAD-binding protein, partial [Acetobacter persici]